MAAFEAGGAGMPETDKWLAEYGENHEDINFAGIYWIAVLTLVVGTEDQFVTPERLAGFEALLIEHSIPYRLRPFKGNHRLDAETLQMLTEE